MRAALAIVRIDRAEVVRKAFPRSSLVTSNRFGGRASRRARREARPPKRLDVTSELLGNAFRTTSARSILTIARAARIRQDSALQSYDATTYQRVSAGLALSRLARERLALRTEQATRVRWRRGSGAYVEVTGSRSVIPIAGRGGEMRLGGNISPIPYYPGKETLWIGMGTARPTVDENEGIVHPLAEGAEAYYTYEAGDSVTFRLPGGQAMLLRELRIRPRVPKWNVAVGSLWFDMSGGQLVRAAYRMAVPMNIMEVAEEDDSTEFNDVPALVKPLIFPMTAQVSAIGVEYGLFEGRFWLPRVQVLEGSARVGMIRSPFKLQQKFEYSDVNAGAPLPPIVRAPADTARPGMRVGMNIGGQSATQRDSAREARRRRCDDTGNRVYTQRSRDTVNLVRVTMPCDSTKLATSPDLPPSIYSEGDEVFDSAEIDALVAQALSMGAQAGFAPQLPTVELDQPRYNRVEGLSMGVRAEQVLGAGYTVRGAARIGVADREPNVELTGARSDLRRTLSLTLYNRLVSAGDWGNPLSLGRSINAFVFGRDEGYYYRASGIELGSAPDAATGWSTYWSLFAEQERSAVPRTTFSLARASFGTQFDTNLVAQRGLYAGGRTRVTHTRGLDPLGLRLFSDGRVEAARGDSGGYGRVALDLTATRGIGRGAAALTLAAGTSAGTLPAQRFWFLGGSQTVRGQVPGTQFGNAFWLARAEVAPTDGAVRPTVFADFGWAGDRTRFRDVGRPMSGVGVGASILDGLLRLDVARGIYPRAGFRVESYVEARF